MLLPVFLLSTQVFSSLHTCTSLAHFYLKKSSYIAVFAWNLPWEQTSRNCSLFIFSSNFLDGLQVSDFSAACVVAPLLCCGGLATFLSHWCVEEVRLVTEGLSYWVITLLWVTKVLVLVWLLFFPHRVIIRYGFERLTYGRAEVTEWLLYWRNELLECWNPEEK